MSTHQFGSPQLYCRNHARQNQLSRMDGQRLGDPVSHPEDFTPVCTTELGYMAGLEPEFAKRNTKIIGLSVNPVTSHSKWAADIEETQGHKVTYPMIGDPELKVAKLYDMLPAEAGTTSEGRTAADNATVRTVFVIGPDKKIKLMLIYPMSSGRNFDEVLRALDSIQLNAKHNVSTPVNWKPGDDVVIPAALSEDQAKQKYPAGVKTLKPYLRHFTITLSHVVAFRRFRVGVKFWNIF